MERALQAVALAVVGVLAAPAAAGAHSYIRAERGSIAYVSVDATSLNTLTVRPVGRDLELRDPTVDGGIDNGTCRPGELSREGTVVQAFCPSAGVALLRVDLGEREDTLDASAVPTTVQALGGPGADRLRTGDAADILIGGSGRDGLLAGGGDDVVHVRDGHADGVACGDGADRVQADQLDEIAADCETIERRTVAAPGEGSGEPDEDRPELAVDADTSQRVARSRKVVVLARSSEPGAIATSGRLTVAGLDHPIDTIRRTVSGVAGGAVRLEIRFSKARMRAILRSPARGRRVMVRLGVVATDRAGNSTSVDAPRIHLRR